ncbi:hypothetical protein PGT21_024940 [Puccinia graminis f. sp. tritici]|uniref:Uncharacterized protein n=1 Tax=Puccinia graminis f. sp. tritici TaxID=56615 RepID=A0A5B0M4U4_PUCGR|nr:hypothetical protein PGTUg99_016895 [Puccinia graminis f. sp. tritici]KAA1074934.1 hypothetical protein PGT21_024940 [Puccinia graminis f. sp. tritici]
MVFVLPMCSNLRGQPQVPAPGFLRWGSLLEDAEVLMQQLRKPVMKSPRMIFISGLTISCPPATSATAYIPPAGSIQPRGCDKDTVASSEPDRTTGKQDLRLLSGRAGSLEFPKGKGGFRRRCISIALYKWNVSPTISNVLQPGSACRGRDASGFLACCLIFYIGLLIVRLSSSLLIVVSSCALLRLVTARDGRPSVYPGRGVSGRVPSNLRK